MLHAPKLMATRCNLSIYCIVFLLLLLLTGCTPSVARQASTTLLEFLQDGRTSKQEVTLKLGPSAWTTERERIFFYRLGNTNKGYVVLAPGDPLFVSGASLWRSGIERKLSLVLVFDDKDILQRHSVVPID